MGGDSLVLSGHFWLAPEDGSSKYKEASMHFKVNGWFIDPLNTLRWNIQGVLFYWLIKLDVVHLFCKMKENLRT